MAKIWSNKSYSMFTWKFNSRYHMSSFVWFKCEKVAVRVLAHIEWWAKTRIVEPMCSSHSIWMWVGPLLTRLLCWTQQTEERIHSHSNLDKLVIESRMAWILGCLWFKLGRAGNLTVFFDLRVGPLLTISKRK